MYRAVGRRPVPGDRARPYLRRRQPCTRTVWGKLLASWGYVVVAPDSFGPRGEKSVCGRGNVVNGNMRVADVAGAIDFLNAQPFVRRGEIGLIGHSHGGWTTVRAAQKSYGLRGARAEGRRRLLSDLPAPRFDRDVAVPLLILIGDKDDWTLAERCRKLQAAGFTQPEPGRGGLLPQRLSQLRQQGARTARSPWRTARATAWPTIPPPAPDAEARTEAFFAQVPGNFQSTVILVVLASSRHCAISLAIWARNSSRTAADRLDAVLVEARLGLGPGDEAPGGRRQLLDDRVRRVAAGATRPIHR